MDSVGLPARVGKEGKSNFALTEKGDLVAAILDGEEPIYPTSVVGHTLGNILMFLIDEELIEGRVLDHASGNGVLGIIMVCYDLMKKQKITDVFFNDICNTALKHSRKELLRNAPGLIIPNYFTNGQELENSLCGIPLDFTVSNIFQDPDPDTGSNLQFTETERIYDLLKPGGRMVVKGPDYAPGIEVHFKKLFEIERAWEGACRNRYAGEAPARVKYLLGVKKETWV